MAIQFNANGEYVSYDCTASPLGKVFFPATNKWTIAFWVRLDTDLNALSVFAVANQTNNAYNGRGVCAINADGTTIGVLSGGSDGWQTDKSMTVGEWVYVALRTNASGVYASYALADAVAMSPVSPSYNNTAWNQDIGYLYVGSAHGGANPARCSVAHYRAWQSEVSDADLLKEMDYDTHANAVTYGTSGAPTPFLAWEFDNSGDLTLDTSGNTRHNTVVGGSYVTGPSLLSGPPPSLALMGQSIF